DMLPGRTGRRPSYRAMLQAFDGKRIETMPGVRAVVRDGRFLGVVAVREEQAVAAAAALAKCAAWQEAADLPDVDAMPAFLRSQPSNAKILSEKGVPQETGAHAVSASYSRPFLAHPAVGPAWAAARGPAQSRYGARASQSIRRGWTSRRRSASRPTRSPSAMCRAPDATVTMRPTTRRSTRCCSPAPWKATPCGCNGRTRTN